MTFVSSKFMLCCWIHSPCYFYFCILLPVEVLVSLLCEFFSIDEVCSLSCVSKPFVEISRRALTRATRVAFHADIPRTVHCCEVIASKCEHVQIIDLLNPPPKVRSFCVLSFTESSKWSNSCQKAGSRVEVLCTRPPLHFGVVVARSRVEKKFPSQVTVCWRGLSMEGLKVFPGGSKFRSLFAIWFQLVNFRREWQRATAMTVNFLMSLCRYGSCQVWSRSKAVWGCCDI